MRKIFVFIIGGFAVFSAFGVGENVPTSKSYIDSVLVNKQDAIERTAGANQALTNTGTAGEYGTKDIYDSTGSYAEQQDAMIDAQTMNTAVQNAINAEFVCISWVDDDPTKDCLLMEIRGKTERRSPNLFDLNTARVVYTASNTEFSKLSNGYEISRGAIYLEIGNIEDFIGKSLVFSYEVSCRNGTTHRALFYQNDSNGAPVMVYYDHPARIEQVFAPTLTIRLHQPDFTNTCAYTNIQIEEGTTATPYQPYGNIYLPAGN